jgi:thiol-disulfide isomerase/thioredoxin
MTVLTPDTDLEPLRRRLSGAAGGRLVACLCAAWCGTCRDYEATFARLAARHPQDCFVWIDVETHADALGDVDIENFPTLLVQALDGPVQFYGPMLPHANVLDRQLLRGVGATATPGAPDVLSWLAGTPQGPARLARAD